MLYFLHCLISLTIYYLKLFLGQNPPLFICNTFTFLNRQRQDPQTIFNIFHKFERKNWSCIHFHYFYSILSNTIFPIQFYQIHITTPTMKLCKLIVTHSLLLVITHCFNRNYVLLLHGCHFRTGIFWQVGSYEVSTPTFLWIMLLNINMLLTSVQSSTPLKYSYSLYSKEKINYSHQRWKLLHYISFFK